mmetsp:Transcript_18856/g.48367  ORF Transcript_18856/g.48367 Transcript_18856/m.48367 type:complete len:218 (+) Transcript_18856:524-1177(+)
MHRWRLPKIVPGLEELAPRDDIQEPCAERLQGQRPLLRPELRHLIDKHRLADTLQICSHDDQALDGLPEGLQGAVHLFQQLVVAKAFLLHHGVHRLLIHCREPNLADVQGERLRQSVLERGSHLVHDIIHRLAALSPAARRDHALHAVQQLGGLILRASDVAVVVQAEGLRHWEEREAADVLRKLLHRGCLRSVVQAAGGVLVSVLQLHGLGADVGL